MFKYFICTKEKKTEFIVISHSCFNKVKLMDNIFKTYFWKKINL